MAAGDDERPRPQGVNPRIDGKLSGVAHFLPQRTHCGVQGATESLVGVVAVNPFQDGGLVLLVLGIASQHPAEDTAGRWESQRPATDQVAGPFAFAGARMQTVNIEAVIEALGSRFDADEVVIIETMLRELGGTMPDRQMIEEIGLALAIHRRRWA